MDRNGAIETLKAFLENSDNVIVKDAILVLHPELAESKDKKILRKMVEHFKNKTKKTWCNIPVEDIISYLEKQKELPFVKDVHLGYPAIYFYDGERMHFQGNPAMEEKQKEQKSTEQSKDDRIRKAIVSIVKGIVGADSCYFSDNAVSKNEVLAYLDRQKEPRDYRKLYEEVVESDWFKENYIGKSLGEDHQPAEWNKEDEEALACAISVFEDFAESKNVSVPPASAKRYLKRLKSFRPQQISQQNINHTVWHNASEEKPTKLPIIHIWYHGNRVNAVTHENTCLQAELDDINFQPDDKWAYVEDLLNAYPHWKPSKEQLNALHLLNYHARFTYIGQQKDLISLYDDLKKL